MLNFCSGRLRTKKKEILTPRTFPAIQYSIWYSLCHFAFVCRRGHNFSESKLKVLYVMHHEPFPEVEKFIEQSRTRWVNQSCSLLGICSVLGCMNVLQQWKQPTTVLRVELWCWICRKCMLIKWSLSWIGYPHGLLCFCSYQDKYFSHMQLA